MILKLNHFILAFVIIALTFIVLTDIKTNDLKTVIDNKKQIDHSLDTAIDDGVTRLAEVDENNNVIINKEAAVSSFFMSLNSSFGTLLDKVSQEKLNLYIPVILITMEGGYYIFYSDEFLGADGHNYISKRWSEKLPYYYEDTDFIYGFTLGDVVTLYDKNGILGGAEFRTVYHMDYHDFQTKNEYAAFRSSRTDSILLNEEDFDLVRKGAIIKSLESSMAYYTSHHNLIAAQYGITYNFSLPAVSDEEWVSYLDDISMLVLFQGYQYGNETGETYNRFASAGAKVTKNTVYYIEQKGWYLVYHRSTCPELLRDGLIFKDERYHYIKDCVKEGAYACPVCNQTGVFAPEYNP